MKYVKFQRDMLNFCDFIQVFVFTTNHHLNAQQCKITAHPFFHSFKGICTDTAISSS